MRRSRHAALQPVLGSGLAGCGFRTLQNTPRLRLVDFFTISEAGQSRTGNTAGAARNPAVALNFTSSNRICMAEINH
jgi:hypothetical protein